MPFLQKLRSIFGWSGSRPPTVTARDPELDVAYQPVNPADQYHDMMELRKQKRKDRYDVYDAMDRMSDVSSVLDAYAEDCTQTDQGHERTVWVEGDDKDTTDELNSMFDTIGAEEWIEGLARDLSKYGDDLARVVGDENNGVTSLEWRDPRDIERIENRDGVVLGFESILTLGDFSQRLQEDPEALPTYKPWEFVHWRIYKQKRLPYEKYRNIYGTSLMWASDRIAKQVKILDDLLMVVRMTRSLDHKIYYVDTGRSPVEEEVRILKRWRRALKRKMYVDPVGGRFDSRFNPFSWCLTSDTSISLLDGRERTITQLLEEYGTDKYFWVYSRDPKTMKIVPGRARCVGKTRLNAELVKVTLDNGESVRCTPDHRWMLKDGSYKEAKDLKAGDSLSPLYRNSWDSYETVIQNGYWKATHKLVAEHFFGDLSGVVVHHRDFDKRNNSPENLVPMTPSDHALISGHGWDVVNTDPELTAKRLEALRASYPSERRADGIKESWTEERREAFGDRISESWEDPENNILRLEMLKERNSNRYIEDPEHRKKMQDNLRRRYYKLIEDAIALMIEAGFDPLSEWNHARDHLMSLGLLETVTPKWHKAEKYILDGLNHKVAHISTCTEREDTYDLSVEEWHNFALTVGIVIHNSEDEFWPVKEGTNSKVENIPGIGNIGEMIDIDHFRDKFFGSFRAPKAYFGYEGDINCFTGDTKVSLLDGTEVRLSDLVGRSVWVYSACSDGTVIPARLYDIRKTKSVTCLVEVTLDTGELIRCTPEHRFMMRDGSFVEARALVEGSSLMPLYRRINDKGYEELLDNHSGKYKKTHQVVGRYIYGEDLYRMRLDPSDINVLHHENLNKRDNCPDNLELMPYTGHQLLHEDLGFPWGDPDWYEFKSEQSSDLMARLNRDSDFTDRRLASLRTVMQTPEYRDSCGLAEWNRCKPQESIDRSASGVRKAWSDPCGRLRTEVLPKMLVAQERARQLRKSELDATVHLGMLACEGSIDLFADSLGSTLKHAKQRCTYRGLHTSKDSTGAWWCLEYTSPVNHKVVSARTIILEDPEDVYDASVDTDSESFALSAGVFVHNCKATLSSQSIRWARAVNSLQRAVKQGLTRLCQIHLAWKDMDSTASKFRVMMVVPSAIELLDRLEAWQTIVDVAERMATLGETLQIDKKMWTTYILENTLWMSRQDIKKFVSTISIMPSADVGDQPRDEPPSNKPAQDEPKSPEQEKTMQLMEIDKAIARVASQRPVYGARATELPLRKTPKS